MHGNALVLNDRIKEKEEVGCVFLNGKVSFYVQLAHGRSVLNASVGENIQCKVTLKLDNSESNPRDNLYLYFEASKFRFKTSYSMDFFTSSYKPHLFLLQCNNDKQEHYAIFGNGKDDHHLQFLDPDEYFCRFLLVQKAVQFKRVQHVEVKRNMGSGNFSSEVFLISISSPNKEDIYHYKHIVNVGYRATSTMPE